MYKLLELFWSALHSSLNPIYRKYPVLFLLRGQLLGPEPLLVLCRLLPQILAIEILFQKYYTWWRWRLYIIYIFQSYIVCLKLPYLTLYKHQPPELDPPLRQERNLVWDLFRQYQALQDIEQNLDILLLLGFPRLEKIRVV